MAAAHIEMLPPGSMLIRVGPDGWRYPQPGHGLALTAVDLGGGAVELVGLDKPVTMEQARAVERELRAAGYTRVVFERHREDGNVERHEVT